MFRPKERVWTVIREEIGRLKQSLHLASTSATQGPSEASGRTCLTRHGLSVSRGCVQPWWVRGAPGTLGCGGRGPGARGGHSHAVRAAPSLGVLLLLGCFWNFITYSLMFRTPGARTPRVPSACFPCRQLRAALLGQGQPAQHEGNGSTALGSLATSGFWGFPGSALGFYPDNLLTFY